MTPCIYISLDVDDVLLQSDLEGACEESWLSGIFILQAQHAVSAVFL